MGHAVALTSARGCALLALGVLGWARAEGHSPEPQVGGSDPASSLEKPRAPATRKPIGGIAGFESVSKLAYHGTPDRPHQLRTTYVFPERVRWQISKPAGETPQRVLHYRYGDAVFRMSPGVSSSEVCSAEDRTKWLLQMELRRALMLFPEGFAWKGDGLERRAEMEGLGSLIARFTSESESMPVEIGNAGTDGRAIDAFRSIRWKESRGRRWPASVELWHEGELAWTETVESVDVQAQYVDSFFLPPDRRDLSTAEPLPESVGELDLPASCFLRIDLQKGAQWEDACAELLLQRAEWSKRLSGPDQELDANETIEISKDGDPVAILLRLKKVPESPPAGFTTVPARHALACRVSGTRAARAERLADLKRALPHGSAEGTAYVRFECGASSPGRFLVVLPYSKPR